MIHKDSLLDAYMTLDGSYVQHFGMLLSMLVLLDRPDESVEETLRRRLNYVWHVCVVTHSLSLFFQALFTWKRLLNFKPLQVIDTGLVFLNIYLMLLCVEVFAEI